MRKFLLIVALALGTATAHADNGMLYFGAGVNIDILRDISVPYGGGISPTLDSVNWKAWVGCVRSARSRLRPTTSILASRTWAAMA